MAWNRNALGVPIRGREMRKILIRQCFFVIFVFASWINLAAQCVVGTVTVKGRLKTNVERDLQVRVELVTPNGRFAEETFTEGSEFSVIVKFSTLKSYSLLRGHRCTNRPDTVVVTARSDNKILARKELSFQKDFELIAPYEFRSREGIVLDVK